MKPFRMLGAAMVALTLTGATMAPAAHAQGRSPGGCTQNTQGAQGGAGGENRGGRSNSDANLAGVIAAAIQNVSVGANALNSTLNGTNLQVVCLNDVLNQNDIRLLNDILNQSPILNGSLNNLSALNNLQLANGVQVLAVNANTGDVYALGQ